MRDVDECDAQLFLKPLQFDLHLAAQLQIKRAERFVEQKDARAVDDGPCDRNALALTARQLGGHPVAVSLQLDEVERLLHGLRDLRLRPAADLQAVSDVRRNGHVRKQRVALKYGVDVPLFGRHVRHIAPLEHNAPGIRRFQPRNNAERRRFSASGRTQKRDEFSRLHFEVDPAQHRGVIK